MTVQSIAEGFDSPTPGRDPDQSGGGPDHGEPEADLDLDPIEDEPSSTSIVDHLKRAPEGSIEDADARQIFSIEEGAEDRLALVAEDVLGSEGIPNWLHLLVGSIEVSIKHSDLDLPIGQPQPDDGRDRDDGALEDEVAA